MTPTPTSETGFTPGPWRCERAKMPDNTGGFDYAIGVKGKIIAEAFQHVDWRDDGITYDRYPVEANARLISSAPDLYHALNYARSLIGPDEVIDAALAKAVPAMTAPQSSDALVERVARAMEPDLWQRFEEHVAKHCPQWARTDQYDAFMLGCGDEDDSAHFSTVLVHARRAAALWGDGE